MLLGMRHADDVPDTSVGETLADAETAAPDLLGGAGTPAPAEIPSTARVSHSWEDLELLLAQHSNWGRWGAEDQRGTLNHIEKATVASAARLVRKGKCFSLQLPLDGHGPQTGAFGRVNPIHQMVATGTDHVAEAQGYPRGWGFADDSLYLFLQGGTQWDALAHIFHRGQMYNGFPASEVSSAGAARNGIENVRTFATRGVLLDVPRAIGRERLDPGEAITGELLDFTCARQSVSVQRGDMVLIRTGDMAARRDQPGWAGYAAGDAPGLALSTAGWIADHEIAGLATDTWGAEVRPNEIEGSFQPLHLVMIVQMGLLVGEIWYLDELARDCAEDDTYEFLLVSPALHIPGAVGSPINPQALK
ncbi:cyclase family protein [Jiangella muralis]|uniref:cyclase family protein n=1 Tax=Jiangella muralis TaxID=702383 RepID=UPI000A662D86|nr:cyclase family protein [Jiangella muralis]